MNKSALIQILTAIVSCILALFLIDPFGLWMASMVQMMVLALAVIAFGALAIFVVHEGDGDERDDTHRALAGRAAFLAGGAVLLLGIVLESIAHALDPWLVVALAAMVCAKTIVRLWSTRYR